MLVARPFNKLWFIGRALSSEAAPAAVSLAVGFDDPKVQQHLTRITGLDFDKIFPSRKQDLSLPMYSLLTEQQLDKLHSDTIERAKKLLKMPPVLPEREERGKELQVDPRLNRFDDYNWVFVDISMGKEDKDRYIVVRETNGTLRDATWEERDRLCQMYHPRPGRKLWLPTLLTEEHLPTVLSEGHLLHVLDLTCVQCPPDSKDFIRVHHTVYKHVYDNGLYQELYSTKHFGGLVWYLLRTQSSLEGLLESLLHHKQFEEAESLVNLFVLCWPESSFVTRLSSATPTKLELVKLFCSHFQYTGAEEIVSNIIDSKEELTTATGNC